MFIHEAVGEAMKYPAVIKRAEFQDRCFLLVVPNGRYCLYLGTDGIATPVYGWEPTAEDLIADDWIVTKVEGIEWPEMPQTLEKRHWQRLLDRVFHRR